MIWIYWVVWFSLGSICLPIIFRILNFFLYLSLSQMKLFGYGHELNACGRSKVTILLYEGEIRVKSRDLGIFIRIVEIWNLCIEWGVGRMVLGRTWTVILIIFWRLIISRSLWVFRGWVLCLKIIILIDSINNKKSFFLNQYGKGYVDLIPCSISNP